MRDAGTIIVGAGPAGLACAACLRRLGQDAVILEQADAVASSWRRHYLRLHLHTPKSASGLPGLAMDAGDPRYPSRDQVIAYLERYARHHRLVPEFATHVDTIRHEGTRFAVATDRGSFVADNVIVATGIAGWPLRPSWPGLPGFPGPVLHACDYRHAKPFQGGRVLVVGGGNSGAEIALDLAEAGCGVSLSVRGPLNVVPRELLGVPIVTIARLQSGLAPTLADAINAPVLRWALGDLAALGLPRASRGPLAQVAVAGKIPVLDIGTIASIRGGHISVRPGISRIDGPAVTFGDGRAEPYTAIVLATGYRPDLRSLLPGQADLLDAHGSLRGPHPAAVPTGLFFCGYTVAASGHLRRIAADARRIASAIARRAKSGTSHKN